jgi:hypothetical protein
MCTLGKLSLIVIAFLLSSMAVFSQAWATNLPSVLPAAIEAHIAELMQRQPALSPEDLAIKANERMATVGFDYDFDPCDLKTRPTNRTFPGEEGGVYHAYDLIGTNGKKVSILAREPGDAPCGCWVQFPIHSITRQAMIIVTSSGTQNVVMPKGLLFEEITLVDKTLKRSVRNWVVPSGGPPVGISKDGTKLYFEIGETPLYLEISARGKLMIVPKGAKGMITSFTDLTKFPKDRNNDYLGYRRFNAARTAMTVKFSHVCA